MTVDWQTLVNIGAGALLTALGWIVKEVWSAVKEIRVTVHRMEVELPMYYVRRSEFLEAVKDIRDICQNIFNKLDALEVRKVDK